MLDCKMYLSLTVFATVATVRSKGAAIIPVNILKAGHYRPASETTLYASWDVVIAEAPIV